MASASCLVLTMGTMMPLAPRVEGEADDIRAVGADANDGCCFFPAHRLDGAVILLDLHRRVLAIEEDEIKAGVREHRHVVFVQRPGGANHGLPGLQQISDRIHAKKPPASITCMLDDASGVAAIVWVVC